MPSPHILFITADELHRDAVGCYGATALETPHLDALAANGTTFDQAYTASHLCLPSRCAILTGLYPHRSGAYSNFRDCALSPDMPNLYNRLRETGYTTGHIGKCHYSPAPYSLTRRDATIDKEPVRDLYLSLGLDTLILQNGKHNSIWFWNDYSRELEDAGYLKAYRDATWDPANGKVFCFPGPTEWHPDVWVGRKAEEYLNGLSSDQPSFTWVSFSGPHYPVDPPSEYLGRVDPDKVGLGVRDPDEWDDPSKIQYKAFHGEKTPRGVEARGWGPGAGCQSYADDDWRRIRHYYFANVALIDDWVGRVVAAARAQFGDNLLVIFTADHGDMIGNHRLWCKNGCGYEDVLRVPLLVGGPGFEPGQRSDARVSLLDILPTCVSLAGGEVPEGDGRDLRESLADGGREFMITEAEGFLTIQDRRWKYLQATVGPEHCYELYDLETDPHEFRNLAHRPEQAGELARLRGLLLEHLMGTVLA